MAPEEELLRADKAKQVLSNPAYGEAVREVQDHILNLIFQTEDTDKDRFHSLCLRLKHHHSLISQIQSYMETGKFAEATLKDRAKKLVGMS